MNFSAVNVNINLSGWRSGTCLLLTKYVTRGQYYKCEKNREVSMVDFRQFQLEAFRKSNNQEFSGAGETFHNAR